MAFFDGTGSNGLAVVVDVRSAHCQETDSVLRNWACGIRALGKARWGGTLRVALREHGTEPWTAKRIKEEKDAVVGRLRQFGIAVAVVPQSPASAGIRQTHSAWAMLGTGGNPYKWAGTILAGEDFSVAPILHPGNYEYVYGWLIERWIRQAYAVAQKKLQPLEWPEMLYQPSPEMLRRIWGMFVAQEPVAVDIETSMDGSIVTAIGLADRKGSVSVPWHEYTVAGTNGVKEPPIESYPHGGLIRHWTIRVLESAGIEKILHNGTFDVVQLQKHGITMRGFTHDTLLMHRVVYPQYRHGLQQACATEFCVEPWKSLFKPPKQAADADPWLGCPIELRRYNCKDSYATWQLWKHLERKLG